MSAHDGTFVRRCICGELIDMRKRPGEYPAREVVEMKCPHGNRPTR